MVEIFNKHKLNIIIGINVLIFILLLLRNPFSDRTLIPNFEPYPDTIHYVNPARSILARQGLKIVRNGKAINPGVPPLYSLILLPFYAIYNDARMFYFTNIVLSFLSFFLFFKILNKITKNIWIIGLILFLYITNYFFYWYPTLAMAENLILPLFLLAIYLLLIPATIINALLAGGLAISFYAAKYASAPLTGTFFFFYLIKILLSDKKNIQKILTIFIYLLGLTIVLSILLNPSAILQTAQNILPNLLFKPLNILLSFFRKKAYYNEVVGNTFLESYFDKHFPMYIKAILGDQARFLWDMTPIVSKWIAIIALFGLFISLFNKKLRFLSIALITLLLTSVYFMANFYSFDMRYIYHAIPTLLLGLALFLIIVEAISKKRKLTNFFYLGLLIIFVFYFVTNAIRLKKQIMLNLKYRETPWYYMAVLKLNEYFVKPKKKPIVISALIPYFIDFYSNKNYDLLPLSDNQDFRKERELIWGPNDYSDLIALYKKYLAEDYDVYVHNSGLGNVDYLHSDFNLIKQNFNLKLVAEGCYDTCNIYKLFRKE